MEEAKKKVDTGVDLITKVASVFQTKSSSAITSFKDQSGFKDISFTTIRKFVEGMKREAFIKMATIKIPDLLKLPGNIKKLFLSEIEDLLDSRRNDFVRDAFTFSNEKGTAFMLAFFGEKKGDEFDFAYGYAKAAFTLAPKIVIIHKSRSNLFGSKEWDEIKYMPASITQEQINGLFCELMFPGSHKHSAITQS